MDAKLNQKKVQILARLSARAAGAKARGGTKVQKQVKKGVK